MNRLYLVRHGENPANITKQFSYRLIDYPLNEKGVLQARQTAACFQHIKVDEIYSSPLRRAIQTAEIIGAPLGLTPQIVENLREMNVGVLEQSPPTEEAWALHEQVTEAWQRGEKEIRFPGGESQHELWARFQEGLKAVIREKNDKTILIVGHIGLFVHTLKDLCPNARDWEGSMGVNSNCSITEMRISCSNDSLHGELVRWADFSHLSGAAAEVVSVKPEDGFFA